MACARPRCPATDRVVAAPVEYLETMSDSRSPSSAAVSPERFADMATHTLDAFKAVADKARSLLGTSADPSLDVFVSRNTVNQGTADNTLSRAQYEAREACQRLSREPLVARVVVLDEDDNQKVYFVSRSTPVLREVSGAKIAGYRSPLGRLAALPVGAYETFDTPASSFGLTLIERAELRPVFGQGEWDSRDTRLQAQDFGAVTIQSLRALLVRTDSVEETDLLATLLADDEAARNIVEGFRREQLRSMSLRDNPTLDQFQDAVFRLPLSSRLVLMGPPGSGKTTTLIKRLGQKLDRDALTEDEIQDVRASRAGIEGHATSWLMFTPTDLLKAYVKEAFNEEGIAAPDQRIQTWSDYRMHLGRRELPILRGGNGGGPFVVRPTLQSLSVTALERPIELFEAFDAWQREHFWADLRQRASFLAARGDEASRKGRELARLAEATPSGALPSIQGLLDVGDDLPARIVEIEEQSRQVIQKAANTALAENRSFLEDLGACLARLAEREDQDGDEEEDEDEEESVAVAPARLGRQATLAAYSRAIKQAARFEAAKRRPTAGSRTAQILGWLDRRIPPQADLVAMGHALEAQAALRQFRNPIRRYLLGIPSRYKRFRREMENEEGWYRAGAFRQIDLAPLELDIVLLAMLRTARELITSSRIAARLAEQPFSYLDDVRSLWRSQIVVDEATDFSPVQLACMAELCDPALNSFLACGDFNQRTTRWGSKSQDDFRWVFRDIEVREIAISYRHSRRLNDLARQIAQISGDDAPAVGLPRDVQNEGVPPVVGYSLSDYHICAQWLAGRIAEIEQLTAPLPTVAVLAPSEADVKPLAEALNSVLEELNLRAVPCPEGKFVGQDNDVRVFDVRHIKGLEFEAVFFVGLDQLAEAEPDVFDNYLYVGATRAATYLGVTVREATLPERIIGLRGDFEADWRP
jgi:hypothetical protein